MALRTVGVRLVAETSDYMRKMQGAGQSTRQLTGEMSKAAKSGHLDAVADRAGVAGLALAGMAGYAVKAAADFDKSMSAVKAATHASAGEIAQLRAAAIQAGKDTQYSATEAADGITELSKAGVSTADVLNGGLKGALSLAAAGQLDVSEAAETAASALTQFKLKGDQVPHVADLLAAAAGKAQGSVHDMGYALNQSGLVASQFGLSIEDTTGALAEFANAGLIGSDAGTSFKTMLLAMANPSKVTARVMQELGISFYDAQGKFVGLTGVANELRDKLGNLTQEERNAALGQIFGNDAIRAATVLYKDGAKGVEEWRKKVNDAGYASQTAADLTDNLAGDIERLKGSLETMAIEAGGSANGGLRTLAKSANALVGQFSSMPGYVTTSLTVLAGVGGIAALALAGFIKLRAGMASAVEQLNAMGPAGERAATGLQKATGMAGKAVVAFVALEGAATVFNSLGEKSADVDRLTASLENLANTGESSGELNNVFGKDFDKLGRIAMYADSANHGYGKFVDTVASSVGPIGDAGKAIGNWGNRLIAGTDFDTAKQQMASLDTAMTNFMTTTNNAKQASDLWNKVASESGIPIEHLIELLPNAYKKVGELNTAADKSGSSLGGLAAASGKAAAGIDKVGGAADSASGKVIQLSKDIDDLFQSQISADRAAIKMAQSTNDLADELDKGSHTLSLNTAEGRRNRAAVLDTLDAIEAERDARVRGGMTLDEASKKYQKDIDGLKKIMRQAGFTEKQINGLVGAYQDIPGRVDTKVTVTGDKAVNKALDKLLVKQYALAKGLSASAAAASVQKDLDRNRQRGYHDGGWTGPGATYEPAGIVHADEYVIRKSARRRLEGAYPGLLDAMNATGGLPEQIADATPGYASGGRVAWPFPTTAKMTRIPSLADVLAAVIPAVPGGGSGPGYRWMEAAIGQAFPGLHVISDYRPGAMTLTGHRSYHGFGRAVDYPPSRPLAEWINAKYFARTKELITPWNDLNIHNGQRHTYTGAVWNQHNFAGGNAHDHWAMATGGTISEPIFGIGASGRTYSFGENYQPERVTPGWQGSGGAGGTTVNVTINSSIGTHPREVGRQVVDAIGAYLGGGGRVMVRGQQVLP